MQITQIKYSIHDDNYKISSFKLIFRNGTETREFGRAGARTLETMDVSTEE